MVPGLRKYRCDVALVPNTAHRRLLVSTDRQTVTHKEEQQRPEHEDRFTLWPQVLSASGLTGRCYWEVWCSGRVDVAVGYRRRGDADESRFGDDHQSWSLRTDDRGFYACHDNKETLSMSHSPDHLHEAPVGGASGVVGVYLDSEAGSLFFYSVFSDGALFHLHTFVCTFSEALVPGFGLSSSGSSVSLI
ncbi:stonustoxin subunit beta-like [Eucyclogobius newberryi]|uniref:stonustoxin subunit beta-like n=1 Tax=Eucyclogobius newberryi TaxID=166745 RepID=UPI003B59067A